MKEYTQEYMVNANNRHNSYPMIYNNEVFVKISDYIPEFSDEYFISNYGRVFSNNMGMIKCTQVSNAGYELVPLSCKDGSIKACSIHRLVMLCFNPIANPNDFDVNHKNGCKLENRDTNLEWSTKSENMIHCYRNDLEVHGEDHPWATITELQAIQICECMQNGMSNAETSIAVFGDKSKMPLVNAIRYGLSWRKISEQYNIPPVDHTVHFRRRFSNEELMKMYSLVSTGMKPRDVALEMGFDLDSMNEKDRERIYRVIRSLRDGTAYKHIPRK